MLRTLRPLFLVSLILITAKASMAQVATGTPPFASYGGGPEVINLGNLNSHITIPVLHKAGRGLNFAYDLNYDSSVWYPVTSGSTKIWQPVPNWGWAGSLESSFGYISQVTTITVPCISNHFPFTQTGTYYLYTWSYIDGKGASHFFGGNEQVDGTCTSQSTTSLNTTALDGSGYKFSATGRTVNSLYSTQGQSINVPVNSPGGGSASLTDRNGNIVSVSSTGVFIDTLGTTVLTVAGSGTPSSPITYTYPAPSGANAAYATKYTTYSVQTNFGCGGVTDYGTNGTTTANLVSEIDLPDGSKYSFTYEPTPGHSGYVTSRLASVTLPTGGTVSYSYSGGNNGIVCADGSATTLMRATPDGTWTYTHSESGTAWTTLVTDPQNNQTNVSFQGIYETQRNVYSGAMSGGALLRQWNTCYNGNTSNCNSTAIALPITQRTVTDQYGASGPKCQHIYKYNGVGGLTEQDDYDYPSGTTLLRKTLITFAPLVNITAFRQQVTVQNGAGTTVSQTNYNYDETTPTATSGIAQHSTVTGSRGNLTSINYPVSGLTSHFTYYDTGSPSTSQDVNGATTTYNYSSTNNAYCQMAFPTSIGEPLGLSRSMTWNCTGGVQTQVTDENGKNATTAYTDPSFWRPASITDPTNATTNFSYTGQTNSESTLSFNSGNSVVDVLTFLDGLGRPHLTQQRESPNSSSYDSAEVGYDSVGRLALTSVPFVSANGQGSLTAPIQTATYDALSRTLSTTDAGGGSASYSYNQNDVLVTIGPAPTGENTKRRQLEYDALGRLTSVCEITALTGSGTCGQTTAQTGYWTKYTYL